MGPCQTLEANSLRTLQFSDVQLDFSTMLQVDLQTCFPSLISILHHKSQQSRIKQGGISQRFCFWAFSQKLAMLNPCYSQYVLWKGWVLLWHSIRSCRNLPPQELYLPVVWALPWKKQLVLMVKGLTNWGQMLTQISLIWGIRCKFFRTFTCQPGSHWLNLTLQSNGGWYCPPPWNLSCWPVCNQEAQLTMLPIKFNMQQAKSLWLLTSSLCSFWKLTSLSQWQPKGMTPSVTVHSHFPRPVSISFWNLNFCNQGSVDNCKHK
jgi:hypothetical protein